MEGLSIEYTDGNNKHFIKLCEELDLFLQQIIGTDKQNTLYTRYNTLADIHDVILIGYNGEAVGCGAVKQYEDNVWEMKRVYVKEKYRHKGYGRTIVEALEALAKKKKASSLILETGKPLVAAQKMYALCGFNIIENYGQYKDAVSSICMSKQIVNR